MSLSHDGRSSPGPRNLSPGCLVLFGLPFLAGGLLCLWLFTREIFNTVRARGWEARPCTIEKVKMVESHSRRSSSYQAVATYSWTWEGSTQRSGQVAFHDGGDDFGSFQWDTFKRLFAAKGKPDGFQCWVNPARPSEAVLFRDLRGEMVLLLFPFATLFPGFGVLLVCSPLWLRKSNRRDGRARASYPDEPAKWRGDWAEGYIEDRGPGQIPGMGYLGVWTLLMAGVSFGALFFTDAWTIGRVVCASVMGGLFLFLCWKVPRKFVVTRRFGRLRFIPDSWAMAPGKPLSGMIPLRQPPRGRGRIKAVVQIRVPLRGGKASSTRPVVETEAVVEEHPEGLVIRADLPHIPAGGFTTGAKGLWILHLKAPDDGLSSYFVLPVMDGPGEPP